MLSIDLGALVDNWHALARRTAPAGCAAVVKADAYGLGATPVVRALLRAGCREFFVAGVDEGVRLRESLGPTWPQDARLHLLQGAPSGAEAECLAHGLVPVLNSADQVARWQSLARREERALAAALQVDTGLTRMGLPPAVLGRLAGASDSLCGIAVTLLMSQLVSADDPQDPVSRRQLDLFRPWRARFPAALGCLANSAGIFLGPEFHFDLVRPGAALYGVTPAAGRTQPMRPVVSLGARLIQWREIAEGQGVGCNPAWRARRTSRLATVALPDADLQLGRIGQRCLLRFRGMALPLLGRDSVDTVTVDVTEVDAAQLATGALFDVIDDGQDLHALALEARTSAFEILTGLGARHRRQYLGEVPL